MFDQPYAPQTGDVITPLTPTLFAPGLSSKEMAEQTGVTLAGLWRVALTSPALFMFLVSQLIPAAAAQDIGGGPNGKAHVFEVPGNTSVRVDIGYNDDLDSAQWQATAAACNATLSNSSSLHGSHGLDVKGKCHGDVDASYVGDKATAARLLGCVVDAGLNSFCNDENRDNRSADLFLEIGLPIMGAGIAAVAIMFALCYFRQNIANLVRRSNPGETTPLNQGDSIQADTEAARPSRPGRGCCVLV